MLVKRRLMGCAHDSYRWRRIQEAALQGKTSLPRMFCARRPIMGAMNAPNQRVMAHHLRRLQPLHPYVTCHPMDHRRMQNPRPTADQHVRLPPYPELWSTRTSTRMDGRLCSPPSRDALVSTALADADAETTAAAQGAQLPQREAQRDRTAPKEYAELAVGRDADPMIRPQRPSTTASIGYGVGHADASQIGKTRKPGKRGSSCTATRSTRTLVCPVLIAKRRSCATTSSVNSYSKASSQS